MATSETPSLALFESQINQANILQQKSQLVAFYLRNYILQQAIQFLKSERSQGKDVTNLVKEVQTWFQELEVIKESLAYQLQNEEMCKKQYYDFTCYQFSRCKTLHDNNVQSQQLLSDLGSVILLSEAYSVFGSPNTDMDNIKNFSKMAHQNVTQALQAKAAQEKAAPTYSNFGRPDQNQGGYSPRGPSQPSQRIQPVQPAQPTQAVNYEELAKQNGYNLYTPNSDEQNLRMRSPSPSQGRSFYAPSRENQQSYYEELARKQGYNEQEANRKKSISPRQGNQAKNYEELARQNGYELYTPNPDDEGMNNQGFSVKNKGPTNEDKIQYDPRDVDAKHSKNKVSQNAQAKNYEELARQNGYELSTPNPDQIVHYQEPPSNQGYNPYESPSHQSRQAPYGQQYPDFSNALPNFNNAFSGFQAAESLVVPQSKIDQRKNNVQPTPPAARNVSVFGRGPSEPPKQQQQNQGPPFWDMNNQGQDFQAPVVSYTNAKNPLQEFQMTESGFVSQEVLDQVKSQVNRSKIGNTSMHDAMQGGQSPNIHNQVGNQGNAGPSGQSPNQGLNPKVPEILKNPIVSFSDFQASESIVMPQASFEQQKSLEQQVQPVKPVETQPVQREDASPKQPLENVQDIPKIEEAKASPEPSQKQTENLDNLQSQQSDEIRAQSSTENKIPPFPGFELIESFYISKIPGSHFDNGFPQNIYENTQAQNGGVPLVISNNPAAQPPLSWLQMANSFYIPAANIPQAHQNEQPIVSGSPAHMQAAPQNTQERNQQQIQASNKEVEAQKPFSGFQAVDSVFVPQATFHKQQSLANGDANHANTPTGNNPMFHLQIPTQEFQGIGSRQLNSPNFGFSLNQFEQSQTSIGLPDFARRNTAPAMQHQGSLNQNHESQFPEFNFQQGNMMGQGMNYFVPAPDVVQMNNNMGFSIQLSPNQQMVNPSANTSHSYLDLMNASRPGAANMISFESRVEPKIEPKNEEIPIIPVVKVEPKNEPTNEEIPRSPVIQETKRDVSPQENKKTASNSPSPSRFGRSQNNVIINVPDQAYITLRELCRYTISELDFSNAKEAKENIRKALSLLNQYSSPA